MERNIKRENFKNQLVITYKSVKPINILKDRLIPGMESSVMKSIISIAGRYLSKKVLMGKPDSNFKKIIGYVLQYGLTTFISKKMKTN